MICFFHKWDKKLTKIVEIENFTIFCKSYSSKYLLTIQQCSKCKKKIAYLKDSYGNIIKQDYDFVIASCKNGKEVEDYFNE